METTIGISVLLVGADAYTLVEAKETLESHLDGAVADIETSVSEAILRLDADLDCLVISDTPGGVELAQQARIKGWISLPVVFYMSGEVPLPFVLSEYVPREGIHGGPVVLAERVRLLVERRRMQANFEKIRRDYAESAQLSTAAKMSSLIGHDIRSTLQAINIALAIMKRNPAKQEDAVRIIEDSVKRSAEILDTFRAETRITYPKVVPVNLEQLVETATPKNLGERRITLETNYEGDLTCVPVDILGFQRVLECLIQNAVDAMPGGGTLTVTAVRDRDEVRVKVRDTGKGILPDVKRELFRPFNTGKTKGIGLALAHCKRIIHEHGGSITVDSEVGKGTTFSIRLPAVQDQATQSIPAFTRREEKPGA